MSDNLATKNGDESEQFAFVQTLEVTIKQDTNEVVLRNPKDNRSLSLKKSLCILTQTACLHTPHDKKKTDFGQAN